MLRRHLRSYLALVLIVVVVSTAWTTIAWVWRQRTLKPLDLRCPSELFAAARGERTISVAVSPERKMDDLEFRFRCLFRRDPSTALNSSILKGQVDSTSALLAACRPISERLSMLEDMGAERFVVVHEAPLTNGKGDTVVLVDFAKVYSFLFEPRHENESVTTFAFLLNSSRSLVGYFEGYATPILAKRTGAKLMGKERLLKLVRIKEGPDEKTYVENPMGGELSLRDLPAWGEVRFSSPDQNEAYGVTLVVKEGMMETGDLLLVAETYGEGVWYEDCSGFWLVKTGRYDEVQ